MRFYIDTLDFLAFKYCKDSMKSKVYTVHGIVAQTIHQITHTLRKADMVITTEFHHVHPIEYYTERGWIIIEQRKVGIKSDNTLIVLEKFPTKLLEKK